MRLRADPIIGRFGQVFPAGQAVCAEWLRYVYWRCDTEEFVRGNAACFNDLSDLGSYRGAFPDRRHETLEENTLGLFGALADGSLALAAFGQPNIGCVVVHRSGTNVAYWLARLAEGQPSRVC